MKIFIKTCQVVLVRKKTKFSYAHVIFPTVSSQVGIGRGGFTRGAAISLSHPFFIFESNILPPAGTLQGQHYFPSSKPPYRFSKVVSFWIFLLIRLGLELGLRLEQGLGQLHSHLTPLPSSENDVMSVCWMENSANCSDIEILQCRKATQRRRPKNLIQIIVKKTRLEYHQSYEFNAV